ncbi:acetyl-CoA carboxylase biotin carboxyl carrier protein [Moraxella sp. FZLJ2107]|uniref:acetyl-CoA carboxylase biotin carboxyl carrier protein n=1 Tax=unclassified Moraxella TaxID=2685852 RepID=UPI00209C2C87|nr:MULTISPECIES: acetyl-CoA carboxylase biotin carboxyl carrier protein [unclassified Moraxella]USZ14807.1 acetyl-CoA carboxylase biotin carboxyl carrier protein [Moraxella sp. FZFQ2102]UTO05512.1 acetyl-CoA carboxylase biotin carboxyl carrier protein [Moraxella sp. FZLJ2107]UTO22248.1 acetyl-CoA carboxylase biotin carboxyl carrier protein [Moraxella sp. FZLJ2109]
MDIKKIRELVDLMEEKDLLTLEYGHDDNYISLTRNTAVQTVAVPQVAAAPATAPSAPVAKTPAGKVETSPMVGVFYSAPSPNDPPFVKVGQKVEAGDTLGIIEAMKIMNPLEATQSGIIEEILVSNAEVVEFGQPVIRYKA